MIGMIKAQKQQAEELLKQIEEAHSQIKHIWNRVEHNLRWNFWRTVRMVGLP